MSQADLKKVLNPSGRTKLDLRSFCKRMTRKSSDPHFCTRIFQIFLAEGYFLILKIFFYTFEMDILHMKEKVRAEGLFNTKFIKKKNDSLYL